MSVIFETVLPKWQHTSFFLFLIVLLGLSIRFFYFPFEVPIVTDGYFSFVYSINTVFDGGLPIGYTVGNTGWANFLSLIFTFMEKTDPMHLMNVQRTTSIILSTLTIIPAYFIFKRFTNYRLALFGCVLLAIEPRLLLISLEGVNYSLFLFLFVLSIAFFLKKTNFSLIFCFVCLSFAILVRYEAILLILPFSIMYFIKFRNNNSILRYSLLIFLITIILLPIGIMRMEATQNICYQSIVLGDTCGKDGFTSEILGNIGFVQKYIISGEKLDIEEGDESYKIHDEVYNKPDGLWYVDIFSVISDKLFKFLGLILIPYFIFFIMINVVTRIKNKESIKWNFDSATILLCTSIMLLPAMYAFMRDISEIRYLLVFIPLICIISISFRKSISNKISHDKRIFVTLIIFSIFFSIGFIELEKRDYVYDRESFKISKEIISYTDVTNAFDNAGYVKAALLFKEWPELPEHNPISGKIDHSFQKISLKNFVEIEDFIAYADESNLEYFVVDKNEILFEELRNKIDRYSFLEKIFDSDDYDYENRFLIFKINFE